MEECSNSEFSAGPFGRVTTTETAQKHKNADQHNRMVNKIIKMLADADSNGLTSSFLDPRRDHDCRNPNPEAIKLEEIRSRASVAIRTRDIVYRGFNMIIESTMLIISNDKKGLIPLRTGPQGLVHLLHKLLPIGNIMRGVIIVCRQYLDIKVPGLNHC